MTADLQALKAAVAFTEIVAETHEVDRFGKVLCPVHDDHTPSCHIYPDGFRCFSCRAHGDVLDWLELTRDLSTAEAIKELERRAGGYVPPALTLRSAPPARTVSFKPVDEKVLEHHRRRAAQLDCVPVSMAGRGFTLADLQHLGFAAYGHDVVFPVTGPDGTVLALKRRYAEPRDGQRYRYTTPGHGTPAWCSPGFLDHAEALVMEGELNGASAWLARPELGVQGVAGTNGTLHLEAFRGRVVYVYGDGDAPGQAARDRWAQQALEAGARKVYVLDPWLADACDVAARYGRDALRERLT